MKKTKRILWGLAFLLAAILLVAGNFYDIRVADMLIMLAMVILLTEGIIHRSFVLILFPIAIVLIINNERLGIPEISPWSILAAALFGSIGLSVLFPRRWKHWKRPGNFYRHYNGTHGRGGDQKKKQGAIPEEIMQEEEVRQEKQGAIPEEVIQEEVEEEVRLENSFGDTAKYFNGMMPKAIRLENSFGNMAVYFDDAVMKDHEAYVRAESSFGNIVLYVPAAWKVVLWGDAVFGNVKEEGECNPDGEDTLELRAQASFGDIKIKHI